MEVIFEVRARRPDADGRSVEATGVTLARSTTWDIWQVNRSPGHCTHLTRELRSLAIFQMVAPERRVVIQRGDVRQVCRSVRGGLQRAHERRTGWIDKLSERERRRERIVRIILMLLRVHDDLLLEPASLEIV